LAFRLLTVLNSTYTVNRTFFRFYCNQQSEYKIFYNLMGWLAGR